VRYTSSSAAETRRIGLEFGRLLKKNDFVAMFGDLGSGKTVFVGGIAEALGIRDHIVSPTFAIVNEYIGSLPLYHFDMYRIKDADSLFDIGFYDYVDNGGICVVEWSENIEAALPDSCWRVTISGSGEAERSITIERVNGSGENTCD